MSTTALRIVILGLSITSSWGNGHATTYRGLVRELARRGHDVLFLERDADDREALHDFFLELGQRGSGDCGGLAAVLVAFFLVLFFRFFFFKALKILTGISFLL